MPMAPMTMQAAMAMQAQATMQAPMPMPVPTAQLSSGLAPTEYLQPPMPQPQPPMPQPQPPMPQPPMQQASAPMPQVHDPMAQMQVPMAQAPPAAAPPSYLDADAQRLMALFDAQQQQQQERSAKLEREERLQLQLESMAEKLANIEKLQQEPLPGMGKSLTATNGDGQPDSLAATASGGNASETSHVDQAFDANVFEQCYYVHMAAYSASMLLGISLKFQTRDCDGVVHSLYNFLLTIFSLCFAARWWVRQNEVRKITHPKGAKDTIVGDSKTGMTLWLTAIVSLFTLFSVYAGFNWSTAELCRVGGQASDAWVTMLPAWYAHSSPIDMLFGLLLSTHGLRVNHVVLIGAFSHIGFLFGHLSTILPAADEHHTVGYILGNHSVQHISFVLGVFLGHSLINGQRRFFDEAWSMRVKLLEHRCDQLQAEKERANYDRQLVQHAAARLTVPREVDGLSGVSGSWCSGDVPAAEGDGLRNPSSSDPVQSSPDPESDSSADAREEIKMNGKVVMSPNGQGAGEPTQPMGLTQSTLPDDSSIPVFVGGKAGSSAGWSELSRLISQSKEKQNAQLDPPSPSLARRGQQSPMLNPNAREWSPSPTSAAPAAAA